MAKTIIQRLCSIAEKMRSGKGGNMPLSNRDKAAADIRALSKRLGMSPDQVVLFTAILQKASKYRIDAEVVAETLGVDYITLLTFSKDMAELRRRGYILQDDQERITVPKSVKDCLAGDSPVEPEPVEGLDTPTILSRVRKVLRLRDDSQYSTAEAAAEVTCLMEHNSGTSVGRTWLRLMGNCTDADRLLVAALLSIYYFDDDDAVTWYQVDCFFTDDEMDSIQSSFRMEFAYALRHGIVEFTGTDGMKSKDYLHIKDDVKDEFFKDVGGCRRKEQKVSASRRIPAGSITGKPLFYNPEESRQVSQLRDLLSGERFSSVRAKMKERGLRTGFSCLFYGAPGTGKTETVYQLAKESGRDLFVVDVSQVKSCWVGDSEKNIREVFTKYRACVDGGGTLPILLFNEADAIFGIRKEGAGSAVDKMENSIQNIILQEMEDLDGILIATTNLTSNLDKAFERRFLYKVRFDRPSAEVRSHIWTAMIPDLSETEATRLASDFAFSGGQIENVSRKKTVHELLSGEDVSFEDIRTYCSEESIGAAAERKRIGF